MLLVSKRSLPPYRNALHHRNTFVEGIRKIAFRNMRHLTRAKDEYERTGGQVNQSVDWFSKVQDIMLAGQGLESTSANRTLIGWATYQPLQVYLCLLYASVEFYVNLIKKHEIYKDREMSACVARHGDLIQTLKDFRDSFLHPNRSSGSHEQNFLKIHQSYNAAPEIQNAFDQYLSRMRLKVLNHVKAELARLSEIERMSCLLEFFKLNGERMDIYNDMEGLENCADQMEALVARMADYQTDFRAWSPSKQQISVAHRIAHCLNDVCPSRPEQVLTQPGEDQTPMSIGSPSLNLLVASRRRRPKYLSRSRKQEAFIIDSKWGFIRLFQTIYVLFNEIIHHQEPHLRAFLERGDAGPEEYVLEMEKQIQGMGGQQLNELVTPSQIILALIHEPLRLYREAAARNPSLANQVLDDYLAVPGRMKALGEYRNSIFHVIDKSPLNPVDRDVMLTESDWKGILNPSVIVELGGLFTFSTRGD